ncbi:DUF397 domain-containing protein [Nocardiopsis potens]|uniref:DUF397 domain-containing protein n=1 Tax=Nocardiopsis potens TaxID=1246458 RepID=UPI00034796AA|nr:DUF397 domain-containing protein [Nocardiopsis potens]
MSHQRAWHTATYSTGESNCVEVAEGPTTAVRDTRNRHLGHLTFPSAEWAAFIDAVKADRS